MSEHITYYRNLHKDISIPQPHIDYLKTIKYTPKVVFDIGAAVAHWTKEAKKVWPESKYFLFEAVREIEEFYKEYGDPYNIGVFSDVCGKEVIFYEDPIYFGGNSYYKENFKYSPISLEIYKEEKGTKRITTTIDHVCKINNYPEPDLVKIDVQGAELDILMGMENTLKSVKHLIVELQHVEYNIGAKQVQESLPFIESLGFELVDSGTENSYFCGNGPDADYHFIKK
jgi:FkbM family methyltransferase